MGIAVWAYLAWVLSTITGFRKSVVAATLCLGLSPQVIRFDIAILSESLGISFAILAIGLSIQMTRKSSTLIRWLWLAAIVLTSFTRPIHLLLLFLLNAFFLLKFLFNRGHANKVNAIVFSVLSLWGLMQLRGNQPESTVNFYTVLQERICKDATAYQWFITHGMPDVPNLCAAKNYAYAYDIPNSLGEILKLPEGQNPPQTMLVGGEPLAHWVVSNGWSTYTQYVLTHPSTASRLATKYVSRTLDASDHAVLSLTTKNVLPSGILRPWWMWSGIGIIASVLASTRKRSKQAGQAIFSIGIVTALIYICGLLTSAVEIERHAVTSAVVLRVLALCAFAVCTQRVILPSVENDVEPLKSPSRAD